MNETDMRKYLMHHPMWCEIGYFIALLLIRNYKRYNLWVGMELLGMNLIVDKLEGFDEIEVFNGHFCKDF